MSGERKRQHLRKGKIFPMDVRDRYPDSAKVYFDQKIKPTNNSKKGFFQNLFQRFSRKVRPDGSDSEITGNSSKNITSKTHHNADMYYPIRKVKVHPESVSSSAATKNPRKVYPESSASASASSSSL